MLSLGNILECNDLNFLQGCEPCQLIVVFFTTIYWQNVGTSQVPHQGLGWCSLCGCSPPLLTCLKFAFSSLLPAGID